MDQFIQNLGWKKMALILGAAGVLLLIFIVFSFLQLFQSEGRKVAQQPLPDSTTPTPYVRSELDQSSWSIFKTETFSLRYPRTWRIEQQRLTSGTRIVILPSGLAEETLSPKFTLEEIPTSFVSLTQKKTIMKQVGFTETPFRILKREAFQYTHTWPFKIVGGKLVQGMVEEQFIVFEDKNTLYVIGYEYDAGDPEKIRPIFLDVLNSLQIL